MGSIEKKHPLVTKDFRMSFPLVSILLPIHNEEQYISRTLKAILELNYPPNQIEILITDGMSTDATGDVLHIFQEKHANVFLFDNPQKIVPTGLNILIPKAKGDILIRVDGHCVIAPNYVNNCVRHLTGKNIDGVGGPMHTIGENYISQVIAIGMSSKFGVGSSSFRTETGETKLADSVPFPAYKREIIEKVGLYDEELVRNQDDEYNYRIREAGGKILLASDVKSTYYSRGSLKKLWNQYFQYGYWKVRVMQKHSLQMRPRQFVPAFFVFGLIFSLIMALIHPIGRILLVLVVSSYLFANIIASLFATQKNSLNVLPLLPVVFAILHFSYGSGFLIGLAKFWNRWGDKVGKTSAFPQAQDD